MINEIIAEYMEGATIIALSKKYEISPYVIKKNLLKANIVVRPYIPPKKLSKEDISKIIEDYNNGKSTYALAKEHDCSDETIRRLIPKTRTYSEINLSRDDSIRKKISESCRERWQENEYREKVFSKTKTQEYKHKISESSKKMWADPEYRKRFFETIESMPFRKSFSNMIKERWLDPAYREKQQIHFGIRAMKACDAAMMALQDPVKREEWLSKLRISSTRLLASEPFISHTQRQLYFILNDSDVAFYEEGPQTQIAPFYIVDCIIPKQQNMSRDLIIEVQGEYWHSLNKTIVKDKAKATYIRRHTNYDLLPLSELELSSWEAVSNKLGVYGLTLSCDRCDCQQLEIRRIDEQQAMMFYSIFHYTNTIRKGAITFGAFINGKLICAASYTTPIRLQISHSLGYGLGQVLELSRLARKTNLVCPNLLSWFISKTIKLLPEQIMAIVSYSDNTYGHTGGVYKACNFTYAGDVNADYFYVDSNGVRFHKKTIWDRSKRMKLTENSYAEKHNLFKVFGKKKTRWVLKRK